MHVAAAPRLICPHDGTELVRRGQTLACARQHTFDLAREGYVNLLPVQDKASRDPGDSKEMVAARRLFLDTGAYASIATALADHVLQRIAAHPAGRPFAVLDAGCGEGYYLEALAKRLVAEPTAAIVHLAGIDVSKWAVRAAAKRGAPQALPVSWAVASNRRPPVLPASTDQIVCLFGFPIWPGFAATQPTGGEVLTIDPGPDHLLELRQIIYPEVRRSEKAEPSNPDGYHFTAETRVQAKTTLASQTAIAALLSMTPHAHRASAAGRAALARQTSLDITIDVTLRSFVRL